MEKAPKKVDKTQSSTINSVLVEPKSRQQIHRDYYQRNKERRNNQEKERYYRKKEQAQQAQKEHSAKYYETESIKILISLKEYTNLSKEKQKLWHNFIWTFKDLNKTGFYDIIQIMKIREQAELLINDYWTTAKSELKQRSKSWNSLTEEQKKRLVKYWGQKKVQQEKELKASLEQQETKNKEFYKEIREMMEISALHEEQGKKGCSCWSCEAVKVKKEGGRSTLNFSKDEETQETESECSGCHKYKKVDPDSGLCRKCEREAEW